MLQVELPVDRNIHPQSIKFDTGVQNKATVTKNLMTALAYAIMSVWPRCMISKGNHVKSARFVLLAIISEAKNMNSFFLVNI